MDEFCLQTPIWGEWLSYPRYLIPIIPKATNNLKEKSRHAFALRNDRWIWVTNFFFLPRIPPTLQDTSGFSSAKLHHHSKQEEVNTHSQVWKKEEGFKIRKDLSRDVKMRENNFWKDDQCSFFQIQVSCFLQCSFYASSYSCHFSRPWEIQLVGKTRCLLRAERKTAGIFNV